MHVVATSTKRYTEIRELPEQSLIIPEYQRPVHGSFIRKGSAEFDKMALGMLIVAPRNNGNYAVIDGQHRLMLIRANMPGSKVLCQIHHGLNYKEECDLYTRYKSQNPTTITELFIAALEAKDPQAVAIQKSVVDNGFTLDIRTGRSGKNKKPLTIVGTKGIITAFASGNLNMILCVIKKVWSDDPAGTHFSLIMGLNLAINFGKEHDYMPERFMSALVGTNAGVLIARASNRKDQLGGGVHTHLAGLIIEHYNKGMRKCRLPNYAGF